MASLLDKVSTLISANLHALVDRALKANSMAVIDQYIRQVENHLADLEDAAATIGGEAKAIKRKLADLEQVEREVDQAVDAFLMEGNETAATAAQSKLNSTERLVETYQEQLVHLENEFQKLLDGKVKLEARLTTMIQQREELQALLDLAKSKEIATKAMKSLDAMVGYGDSDISRIAQGIYARLDKATTATEIQAKGLEDQIDDVLDRKAIDTQLAKRKKKLGITD